MIVEVVAVGDELLSGRTVNGNATTIGAVLVREGLVARHQQVVGDDVDAIADALRLAASRADVVIVTGGLGPTPDDLTREGLAVATGRSLVTAAGVADRIQARFAAAGRRMPPANRRQAEHPAGSELLDNPRGTAPGIVLSHEGTTFFALPGVPLEMAALLEGEVVVRLGRLRPRQEAVASRTLRTWGESESRVAEILDDLGGPATNPALSFYAAAGEIRVVLTARAEGPGAASALLDPVVDTAVTRLGSLVFGFDGDTVERVVLAAAKARGWTVGTAESATGGLLAARLTSVPGASATFRGSVVSYAADLKASLLGVPEAVLAGGVVSEATAEAMASGARSVLGVDVAVAVTGSAGPDPADRPVGTVVVAAETPQASAVRTFRFAGSRDDVRDFAVTAALHVCRRVLTAPE